MPITANQVTFGRLLALPVMAYFVYGDQRMHILGVVVGTLIGLTDIVDGMLARRYGVTVLGSLLDPVADKVFILVLYVPFADRGGIPWWAAAAIVTRELLVTVLRSSLELKGRRLPSSNIAKAKTWVQMIGVGMLALVPIVGPGLGLTLLFAVPLGGALLAMLVGVAVPRIRTRALPFAAALLVATLACARWGGPAAASAVVLALVLGITWISAANYLAVGLRELVRPGPHRALHWLRLVAGGLLPVVAIAALHAGHARAFPILVLLGCELARGALDNFVAHQGIADFSWTANLWLELALLVAAFVAPAAGPTLAVFAALTSVLTAARSLARYVRPGATAARPRPLSAGTSVSGTR
jgi:CDP-diacylglycerol--glycerol-3-phosphate 3-phosphatidyltransferase